MLNVDLTRGLTLPEVSTYIRIGPGKLRGHIRSGRLRALNTNRSGSGRPRFVILPEDLQSFIQSLAVTRPQPKSKRRKRPWTKNYFEMEG
jgi:hypothetical protein